MKIVVLDGYTLNPGDLSWAEFTKLGDFTCFDRTAPEDIISRISNSEAVIINKTFLSKDIIHSCPTIKYIGLLSTGLNAVNMAAAKEKGITVTNIPDYSTTSVAQLVFAHLLNICHHVQSHSESVYNGDWESSPDFCYWNFPLIELTGKTLGIIGFGNTGQATAKIATALGINVLVFTPRPKNNIENVKYTDFENLLNKSDIISLHCPLTELTQGIINKKNIEKMKDGVIIINTSRGQVIIEKDLADALNNNKVFAAGLDVVSTEPIHKDNPLLSAKNCYITPHIAWAPLETRKRLMNIAVNNLKSYISGSSQNTVS